MCSHFASAYWGGDGWEDSTSYSVLKQAKVETELANPTLF